MIGQLLEEGLENAGEVGASIASGLNALLQNTDWTKVGATLGAAVMTIVENLFNFSEDFDWAATGEALGDSFNGLVERIDWGKVAKTLSNAITGILKTFTSLLEETDFAEVGNALADFFTHLDYAGIVAALASGIGAAIGSIGQLLYGIFSGLAENSDDWGSELFAKYGAEYGNGILDEISAVIRAKDDWIKENIAQPLLDSIGGALGIDGFAEVAQKALDAIKIAFRQAFFPGTNDLTEETGPASIGESIGEGIKEGISNAFKRMQKWTQDHIVEPLVTGFKKAFGIASPAKEMQPYGEYVGEGILSGISSVFEKIKTWCEDNILAPLKTALNKAFSVVGGAARAVSSTGESIAAGIKGGISDKWSTITSFFEEKKSDLVTAGEGLADKVKEGISGAWDRVKQAFGGGVDDLKAADLSGFDGIGAAIADGVKTGIERADLTQSGEGITESLKSGLTGGKWDELVGSVWQRFGDLREWFNNEARGDFYDSGRGLGDSLKEGISESLTIQDVLEGEATIADLVAQAVADASGRGASAAARKTIRNIAASVNAEAQRSPITLSTDILTTGLDAVAEKLSAIAQQFITVGRTITDIQYPAVALGTVVPARTVAATPSGTDNTALIEKLMAKIDDLQRAIDGRPIQVESRVDIDGREIGRAMTSYNNSTNRIGNGGVYR